MGKRTRDKAKAEVEDDDDDVDASAFPRGGAASGGRGDEDAFPRGGGGGGDGDDAGRGRKRRSSQRGGDGDGSNDDDDDPFSRISRAAKGASSRAVSSSGGGAKYVETLKYKSLRPGAKLLGIISEVTARGLVMSLPDGLRGTVARAEVAGTFGSSRRNRTAAADGSESSEEEYSSDDDDDDDDAEASLELLYEPGQVLRCAVVSLEKGKTGGKRIELSLRLEKVCEGLTKESLTEGSVAPAVVQSVEDHGYILSFGIADTSGFLPKKNVASDLGEIRKGRIIDVVITGAPKGNKGYFTVTSDQKRIKTSVAHETSATNVDTLLPGMLVNSRIKQILSDGVSVSFMTYFAGTVGCFHTGALATSKGVASAFKVGQRMRARIIFVDSASKRICLTLLPHLLEYSSIKLPKLGKTFQTAKIARVDAGQGVALSISDGTSDVAGYAHVSQLSDERVEKVEKKFKVGRRVNVRVIGHRLLDGVVSVSLKSSCHGSTILFIGRAHTRECSLMVKFSLLSITVP
jgi:rRNA biogenesis protein RRP5